MKHTKKKSTILMPEKGFLYGYLMPVLTIALLIFLVIISTFVIWYQSKAGLGTIMLQDLGKLEQVLARVHKDCVILDIKANSPIDFLTVKKNGFVGSEVGGLNLAHPDKWDGPYLQDNPEVEGVEYQLVKTKQGHFIVPGDSVRLPNGKVIGKDILLNQDTDINQLIQDQQGLNFKGKPLAVPVSSGVMPAETAFADEYAEELVQLEDYNKQAGVRIAGR